MNIKKRITIRDVAREAGVSVKTVSRAINDHPDVSEATRLSVQEVAHALGFHPNSFARGLRSGRSGLIGYLVPDILSPHYAENAQTMQKLAREAGYVLIIAPTEYDPDIERAEVHSFIANHVDGIISSTGLVDPATARLLTEAGIAHMGFEDSTTDEVEEDQGTCLAMEHLIALGHRQFAYITQPPDVRVVQARLKAFHHMLTLHHLPTDSRMVVTDPSLRLHKLEGGYQAMQRLLASGYHPTAVCTSSDTIALGILRALREAGLRVPADISLVGYDDTLQARFTDPSLTTIQPSYQASAAYLLSAFLHQLDPEQWRDKVNPQQAQQRDPLLIVRESTGPAPAPRLQSS